MKLYTVRSVTLRRGGTCVHLRVGTLTLTEAEHQRRRAGGARHSINIRSRPLFTPINTRLSTCTSSEKITNICPHKRAATLADDESSLPLQSTFLRLQMWHLKSF